MELNNADNPVMTQDPQDDVQGTQPVEGQDGMDTNDSGNAGGVDSDNVQVDGVKIDWRASLPPELREHPSLAKFKTPADLFKSYISLEGLLGKKKVPIPEGPEDKEAWDMVFKALGVPEDPSAYEVPIPEGVEADEGIINEFKQFAAETKLLPEQAQKLAEWWIEKEQSLLQAQEQAMEEARREAEAQLRREWGQAFESKLALASRAAEVLGGEEFMARLEATGLGDDPVVIKALAKMGELLSEDTLKGFKPGRYTMTPDEAREQIRKIMSDMKGPYWDKRHPEHQAVVEKVLELRRIANMGGGR